MRSFYFKFLAVLLLVNTFTFSQWINFPDQSITEDLKSIYFASSTNGFAVGANKIHVYDYVMGSWWRSIEFDNNTVLNSIFFSDAEHGFIVGTNPFFDSGVFVLTTDGGTSWTSEAQILGPSELNNVCFINNLMGWTAGHFYAGDQAIIGKTTDGGVTWSSTTIPFIQSGIINAICFIDENIGWAVGTGDATGFGKILKTTDGGSNWFNLSTTVIGIIKDIYFFNNSIGWISTNNGEIYKSTDGGLNWVSQLSLPSNGSVNSIYFSSEYNGWAAANNVCYRTTDGGNTWVTESVPFGSFASIFAKDFNNPWVCGFNGNMATRTLFTKVTNFYPIEGVTKWGDYDNDGDLDILLSGVWAAKKKSQKHFSKLDEPGITQIYRNDGNNQFIPISPEIPKTYADGTALDWGDYDNDGDLDILISGYNDLDRTFSKVFRNDGNDQFTDMLISIVPSLGTSLWGDMDNDGDLDIIINSGVYRNDGSENFLKMTSSIGGSDLGDYDSDGDLDILSGDIIYNNSGNFVFSEVNIISAQPSKIDILNLDFFGYAQALWGDYDNDGDLDMLWTNDEIIKVFRNDGNNSFVNPSTIILPSFTLGVGFDWGDYDVDGDLDIFIVGGECGLFDPEMGIYENIGNDKFIHKSFYYSSDFTINFNPYVGFADYDNDGDLDLLMNGEGDFGGGGTDRTELFRNNNLVSNLTPSEPTSLSAVANNYDVTLNWNKSTDNETPQPGLKYNIVIGTTPGGTEIVSPMSDRTTGFRRIVNQGNTNHNNSWTIKGLSPGTYYWSVQAIDNNFAGSPFAPEQNFTIGTHFTPVWSGNPFQPMNIYITSAAIDGLDLVAGDEIGIFDGSNCVGSFLLTAPIPSGGFVSIIASTDDPTTQEVDGFIPGNSITYKLWSAGSLREITRVTPSYALGDGTFISQGTALAGLTGIYTITQEVPQSTGWNILSIMTTPDNTNMLELLDPLITSGTLVKVQDERGFAVEQLPVIGWINNIGNWNPTEGYYMKVNAPSTLSVSGPPIVLPLNIPLTSGWNIIGYPVPTEQNALTVLNPLISANQLVKVQNEAGNAVEQLPVIGWINNIGNFKSGEGYYLKVNTNTSLTLSDPGDLPVEVLAVNEEEKNQILNKLNVNHFVPIYSSPYLPMNFYVTGVSLSGGGVFGAGDEIGIFDGSNCVGSIVLSGPIIDYVPLIASMDDPGEPGIDGFISGHTISYRFWLSASSREITTYNVEYSLGDGTFVPQGTVAVSFESVLPVELTSFTAVANSNAVNLKWQTATEVNNYGFEIERCALTAEHQPWVKIGFVQGNGNSNSAKNYSFTDKNLVGGNKIQYRLKQIDVDGQFQYSSITEVNYIPTEYALYQNYPNPFNPATTIRYQLPKQSKVVIKIYNILGSEIMELLNEQKEPGIYEVEFNASELSSGTYIYKISADNFVHTKKMILLKQC